MNNNLKINNELINFIEKSPSAFHAVNNIEKMLISSNFTELVPNEKWVINSGKKYYIKSNNTSIIAFSMPLNEYKGVKIIASHSDAPCFKLKANAEKNEANAYVKLNVEKYGGMILSTWFDRPLSIAGRVIVSEKGKLNQKLINIDKDLMMIPNLAIHMSGSKGTNNEISVQKEMMPLISLTDNNLEINSIIAKELNVNKEDIIDSDLFLYTREKGKIWGANDEFLSSPRLDDLQCAFTSINALQTAENENKICMAVIFDNEEVGSGTKQGALSTFLYGTLRRINLSFGKSEEEMLIINANSTMISADNGHALHPNYPEKADVTNRPVLGKGLLIKYSANQKYTTDAMSGAAVRKICNDAKITYQVYHNNSDVLGGSTLGNLSTMQLSIPCADIGAAMLAMHSAYETTSCEQTQCLIDFMSAYYQADFY